ncbi:hypothetical protein LUZ60_016322 [Juncus effusus]|nr:hypothetical protein LUZ60_016322 [Juncus effusus]
MLGSGLNLVTTVIGFGMSATFIVFVCARLICGRIRSSDSHVAPPYDGDVELRSDHGRPIEHNMTGLEPIIVSAIPTLKYNYEAFNSKDDAQCSICLGEYQEKEMLRIIPACNHSFHLTCIDLWLQKQATCPICRLPLKDIVGGKRPATPTATQTVGMTPQAGGNRAAIPVASQSVVGNQEMNGNSGDVVITVEREIQETRN